MLIFVIVCLADALTTVSSSTQLIAPSGQSVLFNDDVEFLGGIGTSAFLTINITGNATLLPISALSLSDSVFLLVGGNLNVSGTLLLGTGSIRVQGDCFIQSSAVMQCLAFSGQLSCDRIILSGRVDMWLSSSGMFAQQLTINPAFETILMYTPSSPTNVTFATYSQPVVGTIQRASISQDPCVEPSSPGSPNPVFSYGPSTLTGTVKLKTGCPSSSLPPWAIGIIVVVVLAAGVGLAAGCKKFYTYQSGVNSARMKQAILEKQTTAYKAI